MQTPFVKIAVTISDLRKATEVLKRYATIIRREPSVERSLSRYFGPPGAGMSWKKTPRGHLRPVITFVEDPVKQFRREKLNQPKIISRVGREAVGRITMLHEGEELAAAKRLMKGKTFKNLDISTPKPLMISSSGSGLSVHMSPSVLLREHNILKTFRGPGRKGLRESFISLREQTGGPKDLQKLMDKRFVYGKSPRVSRHAIRRLEERVIGKAGKPHLWQTLEEMGFPNPR